MLTKLSFREALAQPGETKGGSRDRSDLPVRLRLTIAKVTRPVSVARLLHQYGMLYKAREALDRPAARDSVAVDLSAADPDRLVSEFGDLGVQAVTIQGPTHE